MSRAKSLCSVVLIACCALSVFIPKAAPAAVTFTGTVYPASSAAWNSTTDAYCGGSLTGTQPLNSGSVLINGGSIVASQNGQVGYNTDGGLGSMAVNGGGSQWNCSGTIYVANLASSNGVLNITNGGTVTDVSAYLSWSASTNGSATVSGSDGAGHYSTWTSTSIFSVGDGNNSGIGTLWINNGGIVNAGTLSYIGDPAGAMGTVYLDGSGSAWNTGTLYVGHLLNTIGQLNIGNGATVTATGALYVGYTTAYLGGINFTNGGSITTQSLYAASSQLTGSGGTIYTNGLVSDLALTFDATHGLTRTLTLGAATVHLDMSNSANVGDLGAGYANNSALTINGVTVNSAAGVLGVQSGVTGSATVTNGTWNNSSTLTVGNSGTGLLTISNGIVTCTAGSIAAGNNSTGTVVVDQSGSRWTINGSLALAAGSAATASLSVTNGAAVTNSGNTILAGTAIAGSTSTATVTVDGLGSTWTDNNGNLYIGDYGVGKLNISNGAQVSVSAGTVTGAGQTYLGYNSGAAGTISFNGGTLTTQGLYVTASQITGTGHIATNGLVGNVAGGLLFDGTNPSYGLHQAISIGSVSIDLNMSNTSTVADLGTGYGGNGSITIQNGIAVTSAQAVLGQTTGATGTATITGTGSVWNATTFLVGNAGTSTGVLNVLNGGSASTAGDFVIGNVIGSRGTVTVDGTVSGPASTLTCGGTLFVGDTTSDITTLNITNGGVVCTQQLTLARVAGTDTVNVNGGILEANNPSPTGWLGQTKTAATDNFYVLGKGATFDTNGYDTVAALAIKHGGSGTDGGITKAGAGVLIVSGANTYNGTTSVTGGALVAATTASLPGWNTVGSVSVASGAAVGGEIATSGYWTESQITTLVNSVAWPSSGASLAVDTTNASGSYTYATALTDPSSGTASIGLTKTGINQLTLAGADSYTGTTTVHAGILVAAGTASLPGWSTPGKIIVQSGAALGGRIGGSGWTESQISTLVNAAAWSPTGNALVLDTSNGNYTYNGSIANPSSGTASIGLTSSGTNTLVLAGANTYTGTTTVGASGTLSIASANALPTGTAVVVGSYATLDLSGVAGYQGTISELSGVADTLNLGAGTLTVGDANNTQFFGWITGTGTLIKQGTGQLIVGGPFGGTTSDYLPASTIIDNGILSLTQMSNPVVSVGTVTISGGTLAVPYFAQTLGGVILQSGSIVPTIAGVTQAGTLTCTSTYQMQSGTVSVGLAGSVGLTKSTAGSVLLTGANSYTGLTTVNGGTLEFGPSAQNAAFNLGGVSLGHGIAVFDYNGASDPLASINTAIGNGKLASTNAGSKDEWVEIDNGSTNVTVAYTIPGDANLDFVVDGSDLNTVLSNYNKTGMTWSQGDFNGDGKVDGSDLNVVLSNYNQGAGVAASVPEPSTLLLAAAGLMGLLAYAWRKSSVGYASA